MKFETYLSRRLFAVAAIIAGSLFAPGQDAHSEIGTIDVVPAATLLLPYFEVDLDEQFTTTTLFIITNTSPSPVVAHVVLWTNLGVPTLSFDIPLVGKDVAPLNIADFFDGILPSNTLLSQAQVTQLQNQHTGQASNITGRCSGQNFGDNVARGYITVDTWSGTLTENDAGYFEQFPGDPGYFVAGGNGLATNDNVLWGEYSLIDLSNNFGQSDTVVHIEADASDSRLSTSGNYTFYGRYVAVTAADNREPLVHEWNIPYRGEAETGEGTSVIYWRDSAINQSDFVCGTLPNPYPLTQDTLVYFDEASNSTDTITINPQPIPFPWSCARVNVGSPGLAPPYTSGWIQFDSQTFVSGGAFGDSRSQSFVSVIHSDSGIFSTGHEATQIESAIAP